MQKAILTAASTLLFCMLVVVGAGAQTTEGLESTNAQTTESMDADANAMLVRRIGLVDIEAVLRASVGTARVRELLDEQRLQFQKEFAAREAALQATERELLALRNTLSEEEFAERLSAFEAEVAQIQREIQYGREALDLAFQEAQSDLRRIALEITTAIARERRLDMVLKKDAAIVFLPTLNISGEVLRRLDERTRDARIEIEVNNLDDAAKE